MEGEKGGKVEIRMGVIFDGVENICDEKYNGEEGKQMMSTKEVNPSLYFKNIEEKPVDSSSIDSSTSFEALSQSDLSDSAVATKRVSKRKRNHYLKRKWAMIPSMNINERQLMVPKRRLAKVEDCMTENTDGCEKPELEQGKGDMMDNAVFKNKICQEKKIEKKATKKFWQKEFILRAFGRKENETFPVGIPGSAKQSKPLVHNSGIIRMKLERLRILGKNTKVQLELLKKETLEKIQEKIRSPNSDLTTAPVSGDTKIENLKYSNFILLGSGNVDLNSDSIGTWHNRPNVQPKAKMSFDLRSYLPACIGKTSDDAPDIAAARKIKGKEIDQPTQLWPQWSWNLETRHLGARTGQQNFVPYMPNYPSWASLEAEAEFLRRSVIKPPSINYRIPGSNDSPCIASIRNDPVSCEKMTLDDPGAPYARTAQEIKILDVGPPNLNNSENLDPDFITKSGFSYVGSDSGDKESLKESGTCFSSIRKKLQGWGQAIRGGLTRRVPKKHSAVSINPESGEREEPESPSVECPNKPKKKIFGKNKSARMVVPLTLTFFAVPRLRVVNREEWMEEPDQPFPGDKMKE